MRKKAKVINTVGDALKVINGVKKHIPHDARPIYITIPEGFLKELRSQDTK